MRITIGQLPGAELRDWPRTLRVIREMIGEAADRRTDILLLPECVWPACFFESPQAYREERRRGMPGDTEVLAEVGRLAGERRMCVCLGFVEEAGDSLYNSAAFIDRSGRLVATHRKVFRWDGDHVCFAAGKRIEPFDTEFGRVGIMICADARMPEIPATLIARGARLLLQPTAWVNAGDERTLWNPQPEFLIPARAAEFGVPIAAADKWGREWTTTTVGSSIICDAQGATVGRCVTDRTHVLTCELTLPERGRLDVDAAAARRLCDEFARPPTRGGARPLEVILGACADGDRGDRPAGALYIDVEAAHAEPSGFDARRGLLRGPTDSPIEWGGVLIAALPAMALQSFAAARLAALDGAHILVAFGEAPDERILRTRAAENRVFVLAVERAKYRLVDPRGKVVRQQPAGGAARWTIDAAQAEDKCVAPQTDVIADRTPNAYCLTHP